MEFVLPPSLIANLADWTLVDYSGVQQSPFSGAIRTISRGQRWQAHLQFHDLINNDRAILAGLMASIRGKANRMWIADPTYVQRGSFPAPELFANGSFAQGTANWNVNGAATAVGVNRSLAFKTTATSAASMYQPVAVVNGVAYSVRSCLNDGFNSTIETLGAQVTDAVTSYPNVGLARGLITASMMCAAGGVANQFPISVTASVTAGAIVLCTYASMRRCAMVINPGGLTYYTTLTIDALPINTNGLLLAGDRCEINGEFKTVTFALNSDASGTGILMFEPALRKIVPDNSAVHIGQPMMRGILMNNAMQVTRPGLFSDFDFTFVEA